MKLHEIVKICLLALESRYPACVVEVNESMLGHLSFCRAVCPPTEMLESLRLHAPQLLPTSACLVVDEGRSAIYLGERPEGEPAFRVYCGGCTPAQRAEQQARQLMTA